MSKQYDVLILGTGIAGLSTAIKLADQGLKTALVTRTEKPEECNSGWAQGGIIYPTKDDEADLLKDILAASSHTSDEYISKVLTESGSLMKDLLLDRAKTSFEKNDDGELLFTKEAAHSRARILFDGDHTGKSIEISLLNLIEQNKYKNLDLLISRTAVDLITPGHHGVDLKQRYHSHKVVGAYVFSQKDQRVEKILAKKTIIATGGVGNLYLHNSNTYSSRGDGHAMAKRAGARIINMEFIQFHPTTLFIKKAHRRFLISEALRGEGGKLLNISGDNFMKNYHHDAELASRDIVSQAIWEEMISNKQDHVFLDMTDHNRDFLEKRFPTIFSKCLENGVDISKDPIPVVPAAHYTCGGIQTNEWGETNVKNLYAVGEVACNGLHGANRLASTSLLEGLIFGIKCAEKISREIKNASLYDQGLIKDWENPDSDEADLSLVGQDWLSLKQTMWNYVGIKRSRSRLLRAQAMFREMGEQVQEFYQHNQLHDELIGLRNAIDVAQMITEASLRNSNSIGCFYKED